jgi:hypothetical protein
MKVKDANLMELVSTDTWVDPVEVGGRDSRIGCNGTVHCSQPKWHNACAQQSPS